MNFLSNIVALIKAHFALLADAIAAAVSLAPLVAKALMAGKGPIKARLAPLLGKTSTQANIFALMRLARPNVALTAKFAKAYDNTGSAFVTRAQDVIEVLDRERDFAVVYEPKMRALTGGENFFLGMQDSAAYQHDVSIMRLIMQREDVHNIIEPLATRETERLAAQYPSSIDLPHDLTTRVPAVIVADYFGTPGPDQRSLIAWATVLFWWLFQELSGDPAVEARALDAAKKLCVSVDETIARRKASGEKKDDLVGRALVLQASRPEFTDLAIRNNLVGLIIGAIPTLSKVACLAVDELLRRPAALAGAQQAARDGDAKSFDAHIFEALRFNPLNPVIYRRANRDVTIAASTLRACKIKKGSMVFASNLSAMFDPLKVADRNNFRLDRPGSDYMLWGYGMHTCFGAHINRVVPPIMLRPILARQNLRRAPGADGALDGGDTPPFPQHFVLQSDGA